MKKLKRIEIRVTKNQYERITSNAQAAGYVTISNFLRDRALSEAEKPIFLREALRAQRLLNDYLL